MPTLARILLALVAFTIPLVIAEVTLRVVGSPSHDLLSDGARLRRVLEPHEPGGYLGGPAGHHMELWGHAIRFNGLGMRGPEPGLPKPAGVRRVLILGDSVAFGHGVGQEETFAARLRERWSGADIDVVSGALPGWNTSAQRHFFDARVDVLDPDLVIVFYVINDRDLSLKLGKEPAPARSSTSRLYRWLVLRSRVAEEIAFAWEKVATNNFREKLMGIADGRVGARNREDEGKFVESDEGWMASRQSLVHMRDVMRARGGDIVVYVHRLSNRKGYRFYADALLGFGLETDVEVVDAWPFFAGRRRADLVVRRWVDPHPNALGHELIAEGVDQHLRARGWLHEERAD